MTTEAEPFGNVDVLVPARFHAAHRSAMDVLMGEIDALVEALPSAAPSPTGSLSDADTEVAKAWVLTVIRALPTLSDIGAHDGDC